MKNSELKVKPSSFMCKAKKKKFSPLYLIVFIFEMCYIFLLTSVCYEYWFALRVYTLTNYFNY